MIVPIVMVGVIVGLVVGMVSFCMAARKGDDVMSTLWEIEHDWGYDDDGDDYEPLDDDDSEALLDFVYDIASHYPFKKHVCRVYSICNDCGKLEYISGTSLWWDKVKDSDLCMCLPF